MDKWRTSHGLGDLLVNVSIKRGSGRTEREEYEGDERDTLSFRFIITKFNVPIITIIFQLTD